MSITSLNRYPYFDDFTPSKNHLKYLFKPGRNLQVRELNGIQSVFKDQIKKFSSNIFRNGSRVSGGRSRYKESSYVKLNSIDLSEIKPGYLITGTSGVSAVVTLASKVNGLNYVFFEYRSTGNNQTTRAFTSNEGLTVTDSDGAIVWSGPAGVLGNGKIFLVEEGVFFYDGQFIQTSSAGIAVSLTSDDPQCRIGFDVIDEIVDCVDDPSLLDNAAGYSSFNSPGADRYKVTLQLTKRKKDPSDGSRFITLAKISALGVEYLKSDAEYAIFGDMLAKRTFEESGNYSIEKFKIRILEHKAASVDDPLGLSVDGSEDNYAAIISPNVCYINGYRVELALPTTIIAPKAAGSDDNETYLGRIDLVQVDQNGVVTIKLGSPSGSPVAPLPDNGQMPIYQIRASGSDRSIKGIVPIRLDTIRYTMRDIGKIENRIKTMEYYTALSLLEKSAESMTIKDSNGLDRFKNGFIADDFSKYQAGDIGSSEFRAGLDRVYRELRPSFTARSRKLSFNSELSSNIINRNGMLMIDYDEEVIESQPFATKSLSVNPYFDITSQGSMTLTPNNDTWSDTTSEPAISITVDSGVDDFTTLASKSGILNTEWGSWSQVNKTVNTVVDGGNTSAVRTGTVITSDTTSSRAVTAADVWQTTSTTTAVTEQRSGLAKSVGSRTDSHSWQNVSDVTISTFMRPTRIKFTVTGLAVNTKHYAFFGGDSVESKTRMTSNNLGEGLVSDSKGSIKGEFVVGSNEFYVGEKNFELLSVNDYNQRNTDANYSTASATFFSGGLDVTTQDVSLNVITPTWNETTVSDSKTTVTNNTSVDLTPEEKARRAAATKVTEKPSTKITEKPSTKITMKLDGGSSARTVVNVPGGQHLDPIAQSFKPSQDCFITSIDLYFASVDTINTSLWVEIRQMENGYPVSKGLQRKNVLTSEIKTSADASVAHRVTFDYPIFVEGMKEYCFVIGGWSPNTRVWVARMGDPLVDNADATVDTQPVLGSSFRSQNGTTWNAEQYEDIKYNLNVAIFKYQSANIVMNNVNESEPLPEDPFECQVGLDSIRVYMNDHGLTSGDKFYLHMFENETFIINSSNGQMPVTGQTIFTSNGRGTAGDVVVDQGSGTANITIQDMVGFVKTGDAYSCEMLDLTDPSGNVTGRLSSISGTVISGPIDSIAGIPVSKLIGTHIVDRADSIDSFIFKVDAAYIPTETGRFGGKNIRIDANSKYDVFNVSGAYLGYGSSESWGLIGTGHNPQDGIFESSNYQEKESKTFIPGSDTHLDAPLKLANDVNESIQIKGGKSIKIEAKFTTPSTFISPIINLSSFSAILISNRVEWLTEDADNVAPQAGQHYHNETKSNGSERFKYVTKAITLKNPATDLMIAFDVYKDKDADFEVYYKMLPAHSTKNLDVDVSWVKVPSIVKKDSADLEDRVEYELLLSEIYSSEWDAVEYSSFKIKLVGKAKNTAKPPLFQNFRAIAVT